MATPTHAKDIITKTITSPIFYVGYIITFRVHYDRLVSFRAGGRMRIIELGMMGLHTNWENV